MHPPQPCSHRSPQNRQSTHYCWRSVPSLACSSTLWGMRKRRQHHLHPLQPWSHRLPQNSWPHHCCSVPSLACSSTLWGMRKRRQHHLHPPQPWSRRSPQTSRTGHWPHHCWRSVPSLACSSTPWGMRKRRQHLGNYSSQLSCSMHPPRPMSRKWPQNSQNDHPLPRCWPSVR